MRSMLDLVGLAHFHNIGLFHYIPTQGDEVVKYSVGTRPIWHAHPNTDNPALANAI